MTVANYFQPTSVPEALALLREHGPDLVVMAGGTIAMQLINEGVSQPTSVLGLRRAGLDLITPTGDGTRIGATVTLTTLAGRDDLPLLATTAVRSGSWTIRNMATVGGNLFTPPPGGDIAVALLALDAHVVIAGMSGEREMALADFATGYMTTALETGELVVAVIVPRVAAAARSAFIKLGRRRANTPAVVTVAVAATMEGDIARDVRIALGAVAPTPIRARAAEAIIEGQVLDEDRIAEAAAAAAAATAPATDPIASEWYRRRMAGVVTTRALEQLAGRVPEAA